MIKKPKADYVFECSWEVCNKVGGIYTVVKSKASAMMGLYKNYFLVGPYFEEKAVVELNSKDPPEWLSKVFNELKKEGLNCYFGEWDIEGNPLTILIDFKSLIEQKNNIKKELWESFNIDSLNSNWEFEEPMIWSWAVGKLLYNIQEELQNKKIVGHFHEWLSGFSIFYLKNHSSKVRTVFTTHATMLGRTMSGSGEDLYNILDSINPEERAYHYGVQDKFLTERAAAKNANVFTTVSEITAIEAEKLLGIKPAVILNNGLSMKKFPTIEETSVKHLLTREKIREFLTFYFFPYYNMELEHNLIFFVTGRYEFKNKGLDVLIKSLGKLNEKLKKEKNDRTVSVFFWIPNKTNGVKMELLENKNYYRHIKNYVQWNSQEILNKIVKDIVTSSTLSVQSIFTAQFMKDLEKNMIRFKRHGNPPLVTHNLDDERGDAILSSFRQEGLLNREEDNVKVILYPVYLDGNDGLINLQYNDAIAGTHLGLFPSYYEPWGYTPLETSAMGVASLTTDLAGFGRFIKKKTPQCKLKGIYVLDRYNKSEESVVLDLTRLMDEFSSLNHEERVKNKLAAKNLAMLADWNEFVGNYLDAHNRAFD